MLKQALFSALFIFSLTFDALAQEQSAPASNATTENTETWPDGFAPGDTLGPQPGLGSNDFVLSETTFEFPESLAVKVRLFPYRFDFSDTSAVMPKWQKMGKIYFAHDPVIAQSSAELGTILNISAIKIADTWKTMYGGTKYYNPSNPESGMRQLLVCPSEQGCFELKVAANQKSALTEEIRKLQKLWVDVSLEGVPKELLGKKN